MSFDPYLEWFRIKPSLRQGDAPPDHYVLLGLPRFETDVERIHEAALKRMQSLRQKQTGKHGDLSQRVMNEVAQARLTLTDAAKKAAYDFELQQVLPVAAAPVQTAGGATKWIAAAFAIVAIGGGIGLYLVNATPSNDGQPRAEAAPTKRETESPEAAKEAVASVRKDAAKPAVVDQAKKDPPKKVVTPKQEPEKPSLVKLRDLEPTESKPSDDADASNVAEVATDVDEEGPTFLDRDGKLLGFQRKARGKSQFVVAERESADGPFKTEHLMQGLPDNSRVHGFVVEPDGLSCIYATADGKGLLQAKRPKQHAAWGSESLLLAGGEPVKAAWPTLSRNGLRLFCVSYRNGKSWVLTMKRGNPQESFGKPVELPSFGNSLTQPALSPDGKTMVLRGPEELYVSHWSDQRDAWSQPTPVLSLRSSSGANRALVQTPCFSPDGKTLYFSSNRDGGVGGFDLWSAPGSMLKEEVIDLRKLATKEPAKKPAAAKKESAAKKKPTETKTVKKPPVEVKPSEGEAVKEAINEWLAVGPMAAKEAVTTAEQLAEFRAFDLLRKMPKEKDEAKGGRVWKRTTTFAEPGVYLVAVSLRLKKNAELKVAVESAPGGGMLWLDSQLGETAWAADDLWNPLEAKAKSESIALVAGRHRIVGVVCVGDPSRPLVVRLVSAEDGSTIEGLSVSF
jgi:hypothetical protein